MYMIVLFYSISSVSPFPQVLLIGTSTVCHAPLIIVVSGDCRGGRILHVPIHKGSKSLNWPKNVCWVVLF